MTRGCVQTLQDLRRDRAGAAMVEFAIALPLLLLMIAIIVEGSRIAWTHQAAASGARDAARFIARIAPHDICDGTANIADFKAEATSIVAQRAGSPDLIFPSRVTVVDVTPSLDCVSVDYSSENVPVVAVDVTLQIDFPFAGAFDLFGERLAPLTTRISDETRVYGT